MLLPWPCVSPCAYVPTVVSRPSTTRYLTFKLGTYRAFIQEKAWDIPVPRPPAAGFPPGPPVRLARAPCPLPRCCSPRPPRRAGAGRRAPSQESEAEPTKVKIAALAG